MSDLEFYTASVSACNADPAVKSPIFPDRGRAIVVVETNLATALVSTLDQLRRDLVADGWDVPNLMNLAATANYTAPRHVDYPDQGDPGRYFYRDSNYNNVVATKALIRANVRNGVPNVALLIGHVPVPYSGYQATDGHDDHRGAWACDMFYATGTNVWPDVSNNDLTNSVWQENSNHGAGDGKFDSDYAPGSETVPVIELGLGRLDFSRLTNEFQLSETQLIQRYFDKTHRFRYNLAPYSPTTFQNKAAVMKMLVPDDGTNGLAPGNGWYGYAIRKTANLFGPDSVVPGDPFRQNQSKSFWWGMAFGGGAQDTIYVNMEDGRYTSAMLGSGVPEARIAFYVLWGSYFADFNKSRDFLRSSIGTPDYGLAAMTRDVWNVDSLAVGEHLGAMVLRTIDLTPIGERERSRLLALMGDPSLRISRVQPPANAQININWTQLTWTTAPNTTYYVSRSDSSLGPFTVESYNASSPYGTQWGKFYKLNAVQLVTTPSSGTYWEISQGVVKP